MAKLQSITIEEQEHPIFDIQVQDNNNFYAEGVLVHNSEIILRDKQFCNLATVPVRATDTLDDLKRKIRIAVILGTFQSTLTDFQFLSEEWKKNTEEERLLGVSMTGIMDHPVLNTVSEQTKQWLEELRDYARSVNEEWAEKLDIKPSAAITCIKPEGCTSLDTALKLADGSTTTMREIFAKFGYTEDMLAETDPATWLEINNEKVTVLDEFNQPQDIIRLYVNSIKEVFEIEFEDGNSYKFTGNHLLKTTTGWKRVDQLTVEDEIVAF